MTAAELEIRRLLGRLLLEHEPYLPELLKKIPAGLLSKLPATVRDAVDLFTLDFMENGSIDRDRIINAANGDAGKLYDLFAELIDEKDLPDSGAIRKRIEAGINRFLEANPKPPISAKDFLSKAITETPMVIPPFLSHPGRLYLYAFSGTGKTNLALNMGAAISSGGDFLGWTTKKKTVLFVDGENPEIEIQKRARVIFRGMSADSGNIHFSFPEKRIDLLKDQGLKRLERMIVSTGASIVFLDSFLNFFPVRNENDSSEVRPALDRITSLTRSLQCSVVIIDHTMKPPRDARNLGPPTPRGTGAKIDWSDCAIALEEKKAEGRVLRTLYFTKTRTCAPIPPCIIELDGSLIFSRADGDSIIPLATVVEIVRGIPGITAGRLVTAIREKVDVSSRTAYRTLDRITSMEKPPIMRIVRGRQTEYFLSAPLLPGVQENG